MDTGNFSTASKHPENQMDYSPPSDVENVWNINAFLIWCLGTGAILPLLSKIQGNDIRPTTLSAIYSSFSCTHVIFLYVHTNPRAHSYPSQQTHEIKLLSTLLIPSPVQIQRRYMILAHIDDISLLMHKLQTEFP
jgi:hypothetical protein